MYFGAVPERPADYPDRRQLAAVHIQSQARWDPLLGEWVIITSHRQDRAFRPAVGQCPLCPSAWHQASVRCGADDFALHLELFTIRCARPAQVPARIGIGHGRLRQRRRPEAATRCLRQLA